MSRPRRTRRRTPRWSPNSALLSRKYPSSSTASLARAMVFDGRQFEFTNVQGAVNRSTEALPVVR